MDNPSVDSPFEGIEPRDGFRVIEVSLRPREISLHVVLHMHGSLVENPGVVKDETREIWSAKKPTARDEGVKSRIELLARSLCQYFNAGGDWDELNDVLRKVKDAGVVGVNPEGWHLFDTYIDTEGNPSYVWYNSKTNRVLKWMSDYLESISWSEYLAELRNSDEGDDCPARFYPPPTRLPGGKDPEAAASNDGGPRLALPGPDAKDQGLPEVP